MDKTIALFSILLVSFLHGAALAPGAGSAGLTNGDPDPERISAKYAEALAKVLDYHRLFRDLHPSVEKLHPIAIVEDQHFYVFDLNADTTAYEPVTDFPAPMFVPQGVRAAFSLEQYDNRPSCIITGDAFDTPAGYVTIFHEFVHCHQAETVEPELRENLPLAQKALEENDFMWEINYPFPYGDPAFEAGYAGLMDALDRGSLAEALKLRQELRELLSDYDYQYMVWQEWKEGFALFVENKLRDLAGMDPNMVGRNKPFGRTAFYAGGSRYIGLLAAENPELHADLRLLFRMMHDMP